MDDDEKLSVKKYNAIIRAFIDKTPYEDPDKIVKKEEPDYCYHNWKEYQGLFQHYYYCLICNKKEDIIMDITDNKFWDTDTDSSF